MKKGVKTMSDTIVRTVRVITDSKNKQRWTIKRQADGTYSIYYAELFREGWHTTAVEGGLTWQEIKVRFP